MEWVTGLVIVLMALGSILGMGYFKLNPQMAKKQHSKWSWLLAAIAGMSVGFAVFVVAMVLTFVVRGTWPLPVAVAVITLFVFVKKSDMYEMGELFWVGFYALPAVAGALTLFVCYLLGVALVPHHTIRTQPIVLQQIPGTSKYISESVTGGEDTHHYLSYAVLRDGKPKVEEVYGTLEDSVHFDSTDRKVVVTWEVADYAPWWALVRTNKEDVEPNYEFWLRPEDKPGK